MTVLKIDNFFNAEQIKYLNKRVSIAESKVPKNYDGSWKDFDNQTGLGPFLELGRLQIGGIDEIDDIRKNVSDFIITNFQNNGYESSGVSCVRYSGKFGKPNLPVHWDHDSSNMIANYQLNSNTNWNVGVDKKIYEMNDNTMLFFNPNEYTHWRPEKKFTDDEYITMLFFRFLDPYDPQKNNNHLDYPINHPIFNEIEEFRQKVSDIN